MSDLSLDPEVFTHLALNSPNDEIAGDIVREIDVSNLPRRVPLMIGRLITKVSAYIFSSSQKPE